MRTGPLPAFNEGRSASPPAQSFPVVASMVFAALGSQRPIAPKVMGYLGDRLRHSERARPPSSRSFTPSIRGPSSSRYVPQFSMCRSPTPDTAGLSPSECKLPARAVASGRR